MLELRPSCENCQKPLPPASTEARICSFECTFCASCVDDLLQNVCPNCGGGFTPRPIRPAASLARHPASVVVVHKPVDLEEQRKRIERWGGQDPAKR
ncbi:urease [Acidobacteria bacterium Mor1]|nr:urease [Acidobacteria bacterium Mor1]